MQLKDIIEATGDKQLIELFDNKDKFIQCFRKEDWEEYPIVKSLTMEHVNEMKTRHDKEENETIIQINLDYNKNQDSIIIDEYSFMYKEKIYEFGIADNLDIIVFFEILNEDGDRELVNWFYGAGSNDIEEWVDMAKSYIDQMEGK